MALQFSVAKPNRISAQTERRGDAGPVRLLLGGEKRRPLFFCCVVFNPVCHAL
jgi:hypothetical protein